MGVPDPLGEGDIRGLTRRQNMQLQIAAATWRIETRSDSAFDQITLVLVHIRRHHFRPSVGLSAVCNANFCDIYISQGSVDLC